jgi:hypothetical protein
MPDEPENLVLELLRAIRGDIAWLRDDVADIKHRLGTVEQQIGGLAATEANHYASLSVRLDRVAGDVERIKRRLDLVESS